MSEERSTPEGIRLQKFLAEQGIASRRKAESLILLGKVKVNGEVVRELGTRVRPGKDEVMYDGRVLGAPERMRTIMLNKPRGYVCTAATHLKQTVFDLLENIEERVVPVGRLDKNSEGLLLLSNNGDLVHQLTHPRFEHEKEYRVTVSGGINKLILERLNGQMKIDGYQIRPAQVSVLKDGDKQGRRILTFILKEGRNRQIRKMCELHNLTVHRLVRTRVGALSLGTLKPGTWRDVKPDELKSLLK
jgi:23S rRNA pseudouridine2605 synthase